jgi:hypothetical protein
MTKTTSYKLDVKPHVVELAATPLVFTSLLLSNEEKPHSSLLFEPLHDTVLVKRQQVIEGLVECGKDTLGALTDHLEVAAHCRFFDLIDH